MKDNNLLFSEKNIYGNYEVYDDFIKISYSALGLNMDTKYYKFNYDEIKQIDLITDKTPVMYKFLKLQLKNGISHEFCIKKSNIENWNNVINIINKKLVKDSNKDLNKKKEVEQITGKSSPVEEYKGATFGNVYMIVGIITIIISIYANWTDIMLGHSILLVIIVGAILALFPTIIIFGIVTAASGIYNSKFLCPECKALIKSPIMIGGTQKTECPICKKKLGFKGDKVYVLTADNEKEFEKVYKVFNVSNNNNKEKTLSRYEELKKIKELLDNNVITEEEFNSLKEEILSSKE